MRHTRRILASLVVAALVAASAYGERINLQVTITAGMPIRVAVTRTLVDRLLIQLRHGAATGIVYVLMGVPVTTACDATNAAQLTAELGPGDATHPGQSLSDPQGANGSTAPDAEDLAQLCLDGTHSGDVVIVSFWRR